MAGGVFSGALLNGMTIRESANDGSDFSNPAADYRRLFLGEDGQLHVKDSAGTVTDIGAGSGNVATDTIWDAAGDLAVGTGANTAARLALGAAGGAVSRVNGAVAWNSGTAFPTGAAGDRYWRTDQRLEYFYDGTRWLCTCLHSFAIAGGGTNIENVATSATVGGRVFPADSTGPDLWIEDVIVGYRVRTTNTGSAYWTIEVRKAPPTGASTLVASPDSSAESPDTFYTETTAVDAVCDVSATPLWFFQITKTSTPGNLDANVVVTYRYIGT